MNVWFCFHHCNDEELAFQGTGNNLKWLQQLRQVFFLHLLKWIDTPRVVHEYSLYLWFGWNISLITWSESLTYDSVLLQVEAHVISVGIGKAKWNHPQDGFMRGSMRYFHFFKEIMTILLRYTECFSARDCRNRAIFFKFNLI